MIYFDNAATTWPKPDSVTRAIVDCINLYAANPGRSAHSHSIKSSEKVYECRELISDFFGLNNPEGVIFTSNATHSLNIVINGVLNEGDHVICTVMDHNSVLRPVFSHREKIDISFLEAKSDGTIKSETLIDLIKPNTRLVAMTHVSNVCGTIMPIEAVAKICRENNILFLLDASQSAGILPINMKETGIDYLAAPGHKALYGPMGTGILCINSDIIPKPLIYGGTGSFSKELDQPSILPDKFESGTLNLPGICGLCEGVKFINAIGASQITNHKNKLTSYLIDGLKDNPNIKIFGNTTNQKQTGVVSFVHSNLDCATVARTLDSSYGFGVRAMYQCAYPTHQTLGTQDGGTVRVSLGIFNTLPQIKTFLYALEKI